MEEAPLAEIVVKKMGHRFPAGHPKWGGRKKRDSNSLPSAVATCLRLTLDPFKKMCETFLSGKLTDPDGRKHDVDTRTRIKLLTRIAEHTHARAPNVVAGHVDHRHGHAHLDVTHIMSDPALAAMAEQLALGMLGDLDGELLELYQPPASS